MTEININNNTFSPRLRDALDRVRPEFAAIAVDDLLPINLEAVAAAGTVEGVLPKVLLLHDQMQKELPAFDLNNLDKLELYALALLQAHTLSLGANPIPENVAALGTDATEQRAQLLSDATALAKRGLISSAALDKLNGPNGYYNTATDLLTIANMLRTNWAAISGKTGVTEYELDRAEVVGDQLVRAMGKREHSAATIAAVALERQQAYTLFVEAYDEVRRAVSYLRWHQNDADEIAPSLYAGRNTSKKKPASDIVTTPDPVKPATTQPAVTANPPAAAKPAIGLPGADPFAS